MDGRGLFQFNKIDSDTEEFGSWVSVTVIVVLKTNIYKYILQYIYVIIWLNLAWFSNLCLFVLVLIDQISVYIFNVYNIILSRYSIKFL